MKRDWTSEDVVIDKLLRAQIGRPGSPVISCAGFDPDLANAYVEQVLATGERGRYEIHLAECSDCRAQVLTLAQLGDVPPYGPALDLTPAGLADGREPSGWRQNLAAFFGSWARASWARPQWVVVAGLALFSLIVVPLLVLRMNASKQGNAANLASSKQATTPPAADSPRSQPASGAPQGMEGAPGLAEHEARSTERETTGSGGGVAASNSLAGDVAAAKDEEKKADSERLADKTAKPVEKAEVAGEVATAAAAPVRSRDDQDAGSKDTRSEAAKTESRSEADRPVAARSVATGAREAAAPAPEPPLPKISEEKALRLPDDKGTGEVAIVRGGTPREDVHTKEKSGAIKSEDAPRADATRDSSPARRVAAQPSGRALAAGRTSEEAARGPAPATSAGKPEKGERRIEGKRFRLINGVWTDKAYNPEAAMAAITVVNHSDVYNQLIDKEAGLKVYLSHFGPDERAVIVYKKIAYKLVPKEAKN